MTTMTMRTVSISVLHDLVDGVVDVLGRVEGDARLHAGRQLALDRRPSPCGRASMTSSELALGSTQTPMNTAVLPDEAHVLVVVVGAEHDVGDVLEADQRAVLLADDELAGTPRPTRRSVVAVRLSWTSAPLVWPTADEVVVGGERLAHLRRADVERRHAIGLEPGAHGEGAPAEDVGALHAVDRREARLHDADQVVGDLVVLEDRRAEAQVHRRELRVGRLDVDGRHLGLGRQIGAHLVDARADVGQRVGGVEVELEADVDGREALARSATRCSRCRRRRRSRARAAW